MDKPKTILMKSKSSNSAIASKSPRNKKTMSNAEIKTLLLKKRGVYVEKKNINQPVQAKRRGRKQFLASVLTILSKSTTGTQFPDKNDRSSKVDRNKLRLKKKKEYGGLCLGDLDDAVKKKPKYRSKILNNESNLGLDQVLVLQSKREIAHTPSNYSERSRDPEVIKWSDCPLGPIKDDDTTNDKNKEETDSVTDKKVRLLDRTETTTLVADQPKKEDKKLYNFFVDLLETTFSVYNVKTEFDAAPISSVNSSKINLEIDESVAKKLNMEQLKSRQDIFEPPDHRNFYCITPHENKTWNDNFEDQDMQPYIQDSPENSPKVRRKLKSQSFQYKKKNLIPITRSFIYQKSTTSNKRPFRRDRKKNLLNLLKEQLRMNIDQDTFQEPQNFFQALKVMARNKRRCQKSIRFESSKPSDANVNECVFKRRRLLSASTNSKKPNNRSLNMKTARNAALNTLGYNTRRPIPDAILHEYESNHSLQVYGFDYANQNPRSVCNWETYERREPTPPRSELDEDGLSLTNSSIFKGSMFENLNLRSKSSRLVQW